MNTALTFRIINNFFTVSRSRIKTPRDSWKHSNNHVLFTLFEDVTRPCCERRPHHHRTLSWRPSFRDTRIAERKTHTRVYLQYMHSRATAYVCIHNGPLLRIPNNENQERGRHLCARIHIQPNRASLDIWIANGNPDTELKNREWLTFLV